MAKNESNKRATLVLKDVYANRQIYYIAIPGILFFILFRYVPMWGVLNSFKDYDLFKGFSESRWVGFENYKLIFELNNFLISVKNTFIIGGLELLFGFPTPIIISLLISELGPKFRKGVQTAVFLPHFVSWSIIYAICYTLLSPEGGIIPQITQLLGLENGAANVLQNKEHFRAVLVLTYLWREGGFASVMYLAAIAGIDQEIYEAAEVDGCGRFQKLLHVTLPGISSTVCVLFILRVGGIINAGVEQIKVMSNPLVNSVAEIIDTYVYSMGIESGKYQYGIAADLFKSLTSMTFILTTNAIVKKIDANSGLI